MNRPIPSLVAEHAGPSRRSDQALDRYHSEQNGYRRAMADVARQLNMSFGMMNQGFPGQFDQPYAGQQFGPPGFGGPQGFGGGFGGFGGTPGLIGHTTFNFAGNMMLGGYGAPAAPSYQEQRGPPFQPPATQAGSGWGRPLQQRIKGPPSSKAAQSRVSKPKFKPKSKHDTKPKPKSKPTETEQIMAALGGGFQGKKGKKEGEKKEKKEEKKEVEKASGEEEALIDLASPEEVGFEEDLIDFGGHGEAEVKAGEEMEGVHMTAEASGDVGHGYRTEQDIVDEWRNWAPETFGLDEVYVRAMAWAMMKFATADQWLILVTAAGKWNRPVVVEAIDLDMFSAQIAERHTYDD